MLRTSQQRACRRRGAAMVETALVVMPLFLLLFAVLEFGRFTMIRHLMANAAREGARMAVVNTDINNTSENKTTQDIQNRVKQALAGHRLVNLNIQVYHANDAGEPNQSTGTVKTNSASDTGNAHRNSNSYNSNGNSTEKKLEWMESATYQQLIAVEINAEYSPMLPTFGFLSSKGKETIPMRAKAIMRSEGS